ncbi:5'-methylthioadenosine/S-adenosylhomocysteine nucleosidase family protein [Aspergillus affinis]|uniref:5'-methylthioadenosine/S-adenosylhomocysteine nucleosidase family protein n=1 Tax=Aspergillus affinis TaxID=1070780 RepID=UPI0022FE00C7|nr:uncharacterized protein KD926_002339 [Aspergillus affinis]KAI9043960.1 hypothetical protein KD926_002339 [Aspergillus affinis]
MDAPLRTPQQTRLNPHQAHHLTFLRSGNILLRMGDIIESCWDAFPWISDQATTLGLTKRDNRFGQLGGELFIFTQHLAFSGQTIIDAKLLKIAEIVNRACSVSTPKKGDGTGLSLHVLQRILQCKHSNTFTEKTLIHEIQVALSHFVLKNPEFPVLLQDYTCVDQPEGLTSILDDNEANPGEDESGYPALVNNTLYAQLRLHSKCSCLVQHLHHVRLRLSPDKCGPEQDKILFNILLNTSSDSNGNATPQGSRRQGKAWWKEVAVSVARPVSKKRVAFRDPHTGASHKLPNHPPSLGYLRNIKLGEFCRMIDVQADSRIYLQVWNNSMKVDEIAREHTSRKTFPTKSVPMVDWLEGPVRLSKRVKVTLAYTIARSVWQYYSSSWMATPWTLENIHLIKELTIESSHIRPHPYFVTELSKHADQIRDFCTADDLLHMYPNVLALAIILLQIATQQLFGSESLDCPWSATTINDYYEWAWTTANQCALKLNVGEIYERVVNNCLDPDLFQDAPLDTVIPESNLDTRLSIIYDKIVKPLRDLYHAYRDDWEIEGDAEQTNSTQKINEHHTMLSVLVGLNQFTVAIFCALPLEADAIHELLQEIWPEDHIKSSKAPADNNEYTLGKIMSHNVVLVHMPGMGKGAASQAVSNLRSTFPNIELALVVGICGGVPTRGDEELILGDVVISEGIVQYDLGSQYPDVFTSKPGAQAMNLPPQRIRAKLAKLKGLRARERLEARLLTQFQVLDGKLGSRRVGYPGVEKDCLYQSKYRHKHLGSAHCAVCSAYRVSTDPVCKETRAMSCQELGCRDKFLVHRMRLQASSTSPPKPKIHFGLVGSGDTVMKSGEHRDTTATMHNLVAFEMEASGIWDCLPCLVIKGVCDYADSHKNKYFQNYAATTAAACLGAFLQEWP